MLLLYYIFVSIGKTIIIYNFEVRDLHDIKFQRKYIYIK